MDYKFNISTTSYQILQAGSVIVPSGEFVHFEFEGLHFRFTFIDKTNSDNTKTTRVTGSLIKVEEKDCLAIDVINYESLFSSPKQMFEVGTLKGKKLYVRFSIVTLSGDDSSDKSRIFHYTWYLAK